MKMNKQTLRIVVAAEVVLIVCLCIGVGGLFLYNGGFLATNSAPAVAQPVEVVATSAPVDAPAPTIAAETKTPTAAPTVFEERGTVLKVQGDGTTKFIDLDGGYEVTFPKGWLAVRLGNEDELNAVLASEGTRSKTLADVIESNKETMDVEFDRVHIYPLRPDLAQNTVFGFSWVSFDRNDDRRLNNSTMGDWVREIDSLPELPNLRVTESYFVKTNNGLDVMSIKGRFSVSSASGDMVPFVVVVWFFKPTPESVAELVFASLDQAYDDLKPDLEAIRESIMLFEQ